MFPMGNKTFPTLMLYCAAMPIILITLLGDIEKKKVMPGFEKLNSVSGILGKSDLVNGYSREGYHC